MLYKVKNNIQEKTNNHKKNTLAFIIIFTIYTISIAYFHSPWGEYEIYLYAIVKDISLALKSSDWSLVDLVPKIPIANHKELFYLGLNPILITIYSLLANLLLLLPFCDHLAYGDLLRLVHMIFFILIIILSVAIGRKIMIIDNRKSINLYLMPLVIIASFAFIHNFSQISANGIILLGMTLYIYAIYSMYHLYTARSGGYNVRINYKLNSTTKLILVLYFGLFFLSLSKHSSLVLIFALLLLINPLIFKIFKNNNYFLIISNVLILFFISYCMFFVYLKSIDNNFYAIWITEYFYYIDIVSDMIDSNKNQAFLHNLKSNFLSAIKFLFWYTFPVWPFVLRSIYKYIQHFLFNPFKKTYGDLVATFVIPYCLIIIVAILLYAYIIDEYSEYSLFLIIIPFAILATLQIETLRINLTNLLNWFIILFFICTIIIVWGIFYGINFSDYRSFLYNGIYNNYSFESNALIFKLNHLFSNSHQFSINKLFNVNTFYTTNDELWRIIVGFVLVILYFKIAFFLNYNIKIVSGSNVIINLASGVAVLMLLFYLLLMPWINAAISYQNIMLDANNRITSKMGQQYSTECIFNKNNQNLLYLLWYYYNNKKLYPFPEEEISRIPFAEHNRQNTTDYNSTSQQQLKYCMKHFGMVYYFNTDNQIVNELNDINNNNLNDNDANNQTINNNQNINNKNIIWSNMRPIDNYRIFLYKQKSST